MIYFWGYLLLLYPIWQAGVNVHPAEADSHNCMHIGGTASVVYVTNRQRKPEILEKFC